MMKNAAAANNLNQTSQSGKIFNQNVRRIIQTASNKYNARDGIRRNNAKLNNQSRVSTANADIKKQILSGQEVKNLEDSRAINQHATFSIAECPQPPEQPMLSKENLLEKQNVNSTFSIPKLKQPARDSIQISEPDEIIVASKNKTLDLSLVSIEHKQLEPTKQELKREKKNGRKSQVKEYENVKKDKSAAMKKRTSMDDKQNYYQVKMTSDKKLQDKRGSSKIEGKRSSLESQLEATYCQKIMNGSISDQQSLKKHLKTVKQVENKFKSRKESMECSREQDSKTVSIA